MRRCSSISFAYDARCTSSATLPQLLNIELAHGASTIAGSRRTCLRWHIFTKLPQYGGWYSNRYSTFRTTLMSSYRGKQEPLRGNYARHEERRTIETRALAQNVPAHRAFVSAIKLNLRISRGVGAPATPGNFTHYVDLCSSATYSGKILPPFKAFSKPAW